MNSVIRTADAQHSWMVVHQRSSSFYSCGIWPRLCLDAPSRHQKDSIYSRNGCSNLNHDWSCKADGWVVGEKLESWAELACDPHTRRWAVGELLRGNSCNLFIRYKRGYFFNKWFIQSGCATLFWVYCKLSVGCIKFYIFHHFVLVVALCVGEMSRVLTVQGIFGSYKVVSVFPSLGHISRGRHLFLLYVSTLSFICCSPECTYSQFICSVSAFVEIPFHWETWKTIRVDFPADSWIAWRVIRLWYLVIHVLMEWKWPCVSASLFLCLSHIKKKCCEKATPSHEVDYHNSDLQLSVPGSFLIQLELSESFRF